MSTKITLSPSIEGVSPSVVTKRPTAIVEPRKGFLCLDLHAVWRYRELLYFLIWRDVKVVYKQTILGVAWAILQPVMTMLIFTVIFGHFAKIPSDGFPYPIFAYSALLPWNYFSHAISRSGVSLVGEANLIRKVYFPRIIVPISAALAPLVDFAIAFIVLLGIMVWYGIAPTLGVLALPLVLLLAVVTALAMGLWLSAFNVKYRDVRHAIPFLVQFWLFASPVAYPVSIVPDKWRLLFSLNPMTGVIEGFRWGLLGKQNPDFGVMVVSATLVVILLVCGLFYFKRTERTFADVV